MNKLTTRQFNRILEVIDGNNYFDFESFTEAVISSKLNITQELVDNIVDFLVFDLGINCDSDLTHLPQSTMKKILIGMKSILTDTL